MRPIPSAMINHSPNPSILYAVVVLAAAWLGLIFFPSLLYLTRGGGARLRRPSRERTLDELLEPDHPPGAVAIWTYRTIFPWMAQETQYWSFRYILGTVYSGKTEASEISPARIVSPEFLGGGGRSMQCAVRGLRETYGWRQTRPCCGW